MGTMNVNIIKRTWYSENKSSTIGFSDGACQYIYSDILGTITVC